MTPGTDPLELTPVRAESPTWETDEVLLFVRDIKRAAFWREVRRLSLWFAVGFATCAVLDRLFLPQ